MDRGEHKFQLHVYCRLCLIAYSTIHTGDNMFQAIPHSQQAALVQNPGESFEVVLQNDIPVGNPGSEEILVKLNCTGIW